MPLAVFFCRRLDFRKNLLDTSFVRQRASLLGALYFDKSKLTIITIYSDALLSLTRGAKQIWFYQKNTLQQSV
jgi:hypothetical protein